MISLLNRIEAWLDADVRRLVWGGVIFMLMIPSVMFLVVPWSGRHVLIPIMLHTFPGLDFFDALAYILKVFFGIAVASFASGICFEARALWLFLGKKLSRA